MQSVPEFSFRKEHLEFGFEVRELSYFLESSAPSTREIDHRLRFYAVVFITEGSGTHRVNFREYQYQPKDILFIGKDQIHSWRKYSNVKGHILFFTQDFIYQNQLTFSDLSYSYPYNSFLYSPKVSIANATDHQALNSIVNLIQTEYQSPDSPFKKEIIQSLLRAFFLKIRMQSVAETKTVSTKSVRDLFIRFQKAVDDNISITRNVNEYCVILNTSYKELNNACKALTSKTAKAVIDDIIMSKAKRYLLDPDKNISLTAYMLGFAEPTNFTKFFRKQEGLGPKEFMSKING
ncbi:MAG: AraC family transcriptional regulator [Flavobacteriales bacterium]